MSGNINQYQITVDNLVVDVARWVPEGGSDEPAILIAPGWTATFGLIEKVLIELKKLNRPFYAVFHPRINLPSAGNNNYDGTQLQKAKHLSAIINEYDLARVDIVSHSSGSIEAVIVAEKLPEIVRSVIMINPVGLLRQPSLFRFILRGVAKLSDDTFQSVFRKKRNKEMYFYHYGEGRHYIFFHFPTAITELRGINRVKLHDSIKTIRQLGVFVSVLAAENDAMYPIKKMILDAKPVIDHFKITHGGWHDAIIFHPEHYTKLLRDEFGLISSHEQSRKLHTSDKEE